MRTLNLGILAHVDAGKTSLTERLLYAAGVIDEIGSVDGGSTQTDTLELERQRGITIRSAVVSFAVRGISVNLIDTPGHPDFIAEVERVLNVLDGAVLVISAVEGVQPQSHVLMRTLQRLRIPTLIFVNKIDRRGAQEQRTLEGIIERLTPAVVALGSVRNIGTRQAAFDAHRWDNPAFTVGLLDLLTEHDEALLASYVEDEGSVSPRRLRRRLAAASRRALVRPVLFGSAITGAGADSLIAALGEFLPARAGEVDGSVSGAVFKVERGAAGEKVAYARLSSGTVRVRDRLPFGREGEGRVTGIEVFAQGATERRASVVAGEIAKLWGLGEVRVGDAIGAGRTEERHYFAPPTLETVVSPRDPAGGGALYAALSQLAEQDPLINLRQGERQGLVVSLYGEVQKEVIQATLASDFGVETEFRESTTIYVERPVGTGEAVEVIRKAPNPFLATVGVRVEPAPPGAGAAFHLATEVLGTMPLAFFKAVGDTVIQTLRQGLCGWEVTDCTVTMTHSGYAPRQSHAHERFNKAMSSTGEDFRKLTPLVLMAALQQAGTVVCEPIHRFRLEAPAETLGALLPLLSRLEAVPAAPQLRGRVCVIEGGVPAARVHELQQGMPWATRGEGVLECVFDRYEPVRGSPPVRPRTDDNPLDRKEYLLHVVRRV